MNNDDFTRAARAEAEDRHPPTHRNVPMYCLADVREREAAAFEAGAEWARTYPAAQEPTDDEQAARFAVESKHHSHGTQCLCGFESHRARSCTEHIMTHYFDELSAARAARRDEEKR